MVKINSDFGNFDGAPYLFQEVARKTNTFLKENPDKKDWVVKLGIGNTTEPLHSLIVDYMVEATRRLGHRDGYFPSQIDSELRQDLHDAGYDKYNGYGDEQGNSLLKKRINLIKYGGRFSLDEIFISDGAKCDIANIQTIFARDAVVALQNPVYPVYADSNAAAGRTGKVNPVTGEFPGLVYLRCNRENLFVPHVPTQKVDLIYLCSPNNPTGAVIGKTDLRCFVDRAREDKAIIIFDNAYERYIRNPDLPHSIYEIPGAEECAIEIGSLSKEAGFTGIRLGYTIVPKTLKVEDNGRPDWLTPNWAWNKRATTFFNGASNIAQAGALAVYSQEGQKITQELIDYYMENAKVEKEIAKSLGLTPFGGDDCAYVWGWLGAGKSSKEFAERVLPEKGIVITPGAGFGSEGIEYVRLSPFAHAENVQKVRDREENLRT